MPETSGPGPAAARHLPPRMTPLPAALLATLATAPVAYLLGGFGQPFATVPTWPLWGVLGGALLLAGGAVTGAAAAQATGARTAPPPHAAPGGDRPGGAREELSAFRRGAEETLAKAHALARREPTAAIDDGHTDVCATLAQRVESAATEQLECLAELRDDSGPDSPTRPGDPELLATLRHLGYHAARMRRHAASLAVLCGAAPRPRPSRPVPVDEVLHRCVAEARHPARVTLAPPVAVGTLRGEAAADVSHLLAELIENATARSAPRIAVRLGARPVPGGLAVEVEDRGLGMTPAEQGRMNAVLAGAEHGGSTRLLAEGRIGLSVVAILARRHHATVRLHDTVHGGVRAVVTLPRDLLAGQATTTGRVDATAPLRAAAVPRAPHPDLPRERP